MGDAIGGGINEGPDKGEVPEVWIFGIRKGGQGSVLVRDLPKGVVPRQGLVRRLPLSLGVQIRKLICTRALRVFLAGVRAGPLTPYGSPVDQQALTDYLLYD